MINYRKYKDVQVEELKHRLDIMQTPKSSDRTAFEAACEQFRQVCKQIEEFAGIEGFRGGFEEAIAFLNSSAFATDRVTGTYLFSLWQGADKAATYEASKLGIGQPDWWHQCWGNTPEVM